MKKIITISFLSLIFLGQSGYHFILEAVKEHHKEEMIEKILPNLKDEDLVKISSDEKNIYWIEEEKEFICNGMMYDVVKTIIENERPVFLCIADGGEDKIISIGNKITEQNSSRENNNQKNIKLLSFTVEYLQPEIVCAATAVTIQAINIFAEQKTGLYAYQYNAITSPPPRV